MVRIIGAPKLIPAPFEDEVHDMGDFVMAHPELLGEDVRVISRELEHGPDVRRLDFLVYDAESNQPGLVELKKDFADEKVLLQTLRYADWLRSNPDTIRYQISRKGWDIDPDEIEDNLKIYIVAPRISRVVAELAQYIQGVEFEFVQIQRFKNADDGQFVSIISPLEVPNRTTVRARARLVHDRNSYAERGIPEDRLDRLDAACRRTCKDLRRRKLGTCPKKIEERGEVSNWRGRNVFTIAIRRRNDHSMRFVLGKDFDPASCQLSDTVKSALKQRPGTRCWGVPLQTASIADYRPLLAAAYSFVTGTG